jgi:hypothetical protein
VEFLWGEAAPASDAGIARAHSFVAPGRGSARVPAPAAHNPRCWLPAGVRFRCVLSTRFTAAFSGPSA